MLLLRFVALIVLLLGPLRSALAAFPGARPLPQVPASVRLRGYSAMFFEANRGQADASVNFLARGPGYSLFLTPTQAVFALQGYATARRPISVAPVPVTAVLRMQIVGASRQTTAVGTTRLPGHVNYLIGSDRRQWHVHIPLYAGVRYRRVYPGVDLLYHGSQQQLEYDFVVAPHASPKKIHLQFEGPSTVTLGTDGGLLLRLGSRTIMHWHRPVIYQTVGGTRKRVDGGYVLAHGQTATFRVGAYDPTLPLVIDPVLSYSTYLGGTTIDFASAIAVGHDGCAYIAGRSGTPLFPNTTGLFDEQKTGAFLTKLDPTGHQIVYSTYFGGPNSGCAGVAVGADDVAFVTGNVRTLPLPDGTYDSDFPVTSGAYLQSAATSTATDVGFIAALAPDGERLLYSTFLGGSQGAGCDHIALDRQGRVYVAGVTPSLDFPVTPGALRVPWAEPPHLSGVWPLRQAFVSELDPKRSGHASLIYSALLGGTSIASLAVGRAGQAAITGTTLTAAFPVTPGAFQPEFLGHKSLGGDTRVGYVAELDNSGRLAYGTFLGGGVSVQPRGVALDPAGAIYVTGDAEPGLKTSDSAFQPTTPNDNPFVLKIAPGRAGAASLLYATYLGGPGNAKFNGFGDAPGISNSSAIAVDATGDAYIAGSTDDSNFPTTPDAIEASYNTREQGTPCAFLSILDPVGARLLWSSYLGEGGNTYQPSLALDRLGDAYVAGTTTFNLLTTTPGAYLQFPPGGLLDGFALKISGETPPGPYIANLRPYPVFVGEGGQPLTITGTGFVPGAAVSFNSGPFMPATTLSPTRLTVTIPQQLAASPQPVLVTVVNPANGDWTSAILPVIDPAPTVIMLSPPTLPAQSQDGGMRIYGSGMFPGTVVSFNGGPPVPIFYDLPNASFVTVPAAALAHTGTVDVAVINPAPRRGTAHAVLLVTDDRPRTLTGNDLEGLGIRSRRLSAPVGLQPPTGDKIVATVNIVNDTRFHITSMTFRLDLYVPAPGGGQKVGASLPYTVSLSMDPTDTLDVSSDPIQPPLVPGTAIVGYFMTLLSVQGTPAPIDPALPALSRLITAAMTGNMAVLQEVAQAQPKLVRAGPELFGGATLLGNAAAAGHTSVVSYLLAHGAPINLADRIGYTPLLYAVSWRHPEVVRVLLAHHADMTARDPQGLTPLELAIEQASTGGGGDAERQIVQILKAAAR